MKRVRAYDGLKAFSIISIILYHLWPNFVPGGFLTVNLFLVLSAYFLVSRMERTQFSIRELLDYLVKTIRNLWFPLFWFICLILIYLYFVDPSILKSLRSDTIWSLTFLNNFYQVMSERSYFTDMAFASPFTHLWYLAIHVQSLLVSAVLIYISQRLKMKRQTKAMGWLLLLTMSHLAYTLFYRPGADPSNVYYGFLTRFSSFAAGIAAYYLKEDVSISLQYFSKPIANLFKVVLSSFIVLAMVILVFKASDQADITYFVWLPYYNLLTMALLVVDIQENFLLNRLLSLKPLTFIGQKTFSYYLVYYPVIVFAFQYLRDFQSHVDLFKAAILLGIFLLGTLVYYGIQAPKVPLLLETGAFSVQEIKAQFTSKHIGRHFSLYVSRLFCFIVVLLYASYAFKLTDNQKPLALFELEYMNYKTKANIQNKPFPGEDKIIEVKEKIAQLDQNYTTYLDTPYTIEDPIEDAMRRDPALALTQEIDHISEERDEALALIADADPELFERLTSNELAYAITTPVTFFGDSLAMLNGPMTEELFVSSHTYGYVSLQVWYSYDKMQALLDQGLVEDTVVIILGTNAGLEVDGLERLLEMLGDRKIFLVNTNSNVEHLTQVNEVIHEVAQDWDNVFEVDWYSVAYGHPEYYAEDDIHLSPDGIFEYGILLAKEIYKHK